MSRSVPIVALSVALTLVLLAVVSVAIPGRARASVPSGSLSQLPASNCVSEEEAGGTLACTMLVRSGLSSTYEVQVSPENNNAYSVAINGALVEYSRNQATGALTVIGCVTSETTVCAPDNETKEVAAMLKPAAIAISPDGKNAYVVTQGNNNLVEFSRNSETGLLSEIGCISHETRAPVPQRKPRDSTNRMASRSARMAKACTSRATPTRRSPSSLVTRLPGS